jgi:diguanylate cyclase
LPRRFGIVDTVEKPSISGKRLLRAYRGSGHAYGAPHSSAHDPRRRQDAENMLKYNDSVERSAELLRLTIPLMSKHKAGMDPISYAVWYEYVSGRSLPLIAEIDALTANGDTLDQAQTRTLYRRYIVDPEQAAIRIAETQLDHVMEEVGASAVDSETQAAAYDQSLERFSTALDESAAGAAVSGDAVAPLKNGIDQVLTETRGIRSSIQSLRGVLDAGRREIEQLRTQLQKTAEEATTDALTGLRNRKGFDSALRAMIAEASTEGTSLALVMLDIDHFKRINDTYGHLLGDKVLRIVAQMLRDNVRGADVVARYGGEEFTILLPRTTLAGARTVAGVACSRIALGRIRDLKGGMVEHVTVSAGVGEYRKGETEDEFINRVDTALYTSKREGRNRVSCAP